jgi:hypothetical protein
MVNARYTQQITRLQLHGGGNQKQGQFVEHGTGPHSRYRLFAFRLR